MKYENILGIEDFHIFESVLKENNALNTALGMAVSNLSGVVNPGGVWGWMTLCAIKNDSSTFLEHQISRLRTDPNQIEKEITINLILFAFMGYEMESWVNHKNRMSDVGRLAIGFFSSSKMRKWEESLAARLIECVRWIYSSNMLLLIHCIIMCESQNITYDIVKLKDIASYLVTLYCSCDSALECFIVDYKDLLSSKYHYIHDILLVTEKSHGPFINGLTLNEDDLKILNTYCSVENRNRILKNIEERTIK